MRSIWRAALWGATRILMGLRYEEEQVEAMIEGVSAMLYGIRGIEESSVYQGLLRRGEAKGAEPAHLEDLPTGDALAMPGREFANMQHGSPLVSTFSMTHITSPFQEWKPLSPSLPMRTESTL